MLDSPIKGTFPDRDKIRCRDCLFRDGTKIIVYGKSIPVGVTKARCDKYKPPIYNTKPHDVLFRNADCKYYIKDNEV